MLEDEVARWNEEEHRLLNLMAEVDSAEMTSREDSLHRAALMETARRALREARGRVAAILAREEADGVGA